MNMNALYSILSQKESADGKSYTPEENEQFKAILNAISGFNMTVEIIGSWIWAFDSYPYKDKLKALNFKWCSRKKRGRGTVNHTTDTIQKKCRWILSGRNMVLM